MKFKLETNADVDCIRFENTDKKKYLCVLFKAEWCGHCKEFLPVFEQIIVKLHDYDISFLIIDENDKDEYNKFLINDLIIPVSKNVKNYDPLTISGYPTIALFESDPTLKHFYFAELYTGDRQMLNDYLLYTVLKENFGNIYDETVY